MPLVVRVPDLHLRRTPEIEPGVARHRHDAPVGPHLEVLVVLLRRERVAAAVAVEVEVAVPHVPVLVAALVGDLLHLGALLRGRRLADDRVVELLLGRDALPELGEIGFVAVEVGREALGARHALLRADFAHLRVGGQILHADVAPLDVAAVAKPTDRAGRVMQPRMLLPVGRVAVALELRDVALRDKIAVQVDLDLAADDLDLLEVPEARPPDVAAAAGEVLLLAPDLLVDVVAQRRNDAVDRAGVLIGLELVRLLLAVVVSAAAVVEELQLAHPVVRGVLAGLHADAEAVVAVLGHHELEAEDEVGEAAGRPEIAPDALRELAVGEALQDARLLLADAVHHRGAFPTGQILAVEERDEALVDLGRIHGILRFNADTTGYRDERDGRQQSMAVFHAAIIPKNSRCCRGFGGAWQAATHCRFFGAVSPRRRGRRFRSGT